METMSLDKIEKAKNGLVDYAEYQRLRAEMNESRLLELSNRFERMELLLLSMKEDFDQVFLKKTPKTPSELLTKDLSLWKEALKNFWRKITNLKFW